MKPILAAVLGAALGVAIVVSTASVAPPMMASNGAGIQAGLGQLVASPVEKMPPEMARAYLRGIQEALTARGYRPGAADGTVGSRTRAAIRAYERDAGLPVSGEATAELLDHLKFARRKAAARRDPPSLVPAVQRALVARGYEPGPIDGIVGTRTRAAVRAFQEDAGFRATGEVDAALLEELKAAN